MANKRPTSPQRSDPDPAGHVSWRRRRLERAGFPTPLARALAGDRRVDVHALLELVDRGCAPELAARIRAPLDVPAGQTAWGTRPRDEPPDPAA